MSMKEIDNKNATLGNAIRGIMYAIHNMYNMYTIHKQKLSRNRVREKART